MQGIIGKSLIVASAAMLLAACKNDGETQNGGGASSGELPSASELCVSSDCGEAVQLVEIPDAENILFADDGRLFVTGGLNVYEVTRDSGGSFAARPMSDAECGFTGMAIRSGYLYVTCGDSRFFAGPLTAQTTVTEIFQFEGMCIPNGTALGPDGRIYVIDEPLNCLEADPKIVALTVDPADPMRIVSQEVWVQGSPTGLLWLGQDNVLRFPNGLVQRDGIFYGTDGGSIFSVAWNADGTAGAVTPLYFEPTAHDDLGLIADGLLVTDFFAGRIFLLSLGGDLLQETLPNTFVEPSSVRIGRPPMFERTDILVTEKGVITDNNLPLDFLTVFRPTGG